MSTLDRTGSSSSNLHGSYAWPQSLQGIHFGPGSIKTALPKLLAKFGAKKALVVTGRSLHEKVGRLLLL